MVIGSVYGERHLTNFDFLKSDAIFSSFANTAIAAELTFNIDAASSAVNCRRAAEFAVKWMYTVDADLRIPYQDELITLINTEEFKDVVGIDIYNRLNYLRKLGNTANHTPKKLTNDQVKLALKNLHVFMDFIAYSYGSNYIQTEFKESLLIKQTDKLEIPKHKIDFEILYEKLKVENLHLKDQLTKQ